MPPHSNVSDDLTVIDLENPCMKDLPVLFALWNNGFHRDENTWSVNINDTDIRVRFADKQKVEIFYEQSEKLVKLLREDSSIEREASPPEELIFEAVIKRHEVKLKYLHHQNFSAQLTETGKLFPCKIIFKVEEESKKERTVLIFHTFQRVNVSPFPDAPFHIDLKNPKIFSIPLLWSALKGTLKLTVNSNEMILTRCSKHAQNPLHHDVYFTLSNGETTKYKSGGDGINYNSSATFYLTPNVFTYKIFSEPRERLIKFIPEGKSIKPENSGTASDVKFLEDTGIVKYSEKEKFHEPIHWECMESRLANLMPEPYSLHPKKGVRTDRGKYICMRNIFSQDLFAFLEKMLKLDTVELAQCLKIAIEVVKAFRVILESGILHRDIKPENLLLLPDYSIIPCDFGKSCPLDAIDSEYEGTLVYMAPEIFLKEKKCSVYSDLYSLGRVLFLIFRGYTNSYQITDADWMEKNFKPLLCDFNSLFIGVQGMDTKDRNEISRMLKNLLLIKPAEKRSLKKCEETLLRVWKRHSSEVAVVFPENFGTGWGGDKDLSDAKSKKKISQRWSAFFKIKKKTRVDHSLHTLAGFSSKFPQAQ